MFDLAVPPVLRGWNWWYYAGRLEKYLVVWVVEIPGDAQPAKPAPIITSVVFCILSAINTS